MRSLYLLCHFVYEIVRSLCLLYLLLGNVCYISAIGYRGVYDNVYHEGYISRLRDFHVISPLDIPKCKRNKRSRCIRKIGNL